MYEKSIHHLQYSARTVSVEDDNISVVLINKTTFMKGGYVSRGFGVRERRLLDELESVDHNEVVVSWLSTNRSEAEALKRAARSLEKKGKAGLLRMKIGGRYRLVVTTPELAEKIRRKQEEDEVIDAKMDFMLAEQRYYRLKDKYGSSE